MSVTTIRSQVQGGAGRRSPGLTFEARQKTLAYALLLPAAATIALLIVYPLYQVVELSFREGRVMNFSRIGTMPLGFAQYARLFSDRAFWHAASTSAVYVGGSVFVAFLVGLLTAVLLNREIPARRLLRTLVLLPWAIPGVIVSIVFLWLLDGSFGVVNAILRNVGLLQGDQPWFVDQRTALIAVMLPTVWKTYPLITLTLLAAMQSIPKELYEAAEVDGAKPRHRFLHITWPGIQAAALLAVMVSALGTFRDVDIIFATTGGGPARVTETLAVYVYNEAFQYFRMGSAAAVGTIMIGIAFALVLVLVRFAGRSKF